MDEAPALVRGQSTFEDRVPDSREWYAEKTPHLSQGLETVRRTVGLLDGCMRSAIRIGPRLYDACGSAEVSGIVLSFISLHRLLYEYLDDLLRRVALAADDVVIASPRPRGRASNGLSSRGRAVCATTGRKPSEGAAVALAAIDEFRETEELLELADCLVDAAGKVDAESRLARALPGPVGGVMMFLEYVSRALAVAETVFDDLEANPAETTIPLWGVAIVAAGLSRRFSSSSRAIVPACVATSLLIARRVVRAASIASRLREVDVALQAAVRLWSVLNVTLDDGLRLTRENQSYCSLLKPLTKRGGLPERSLKAVPAPPDLCFWWRLGVPWQLAVISWSARTWFAACHVAGRVLGSGGPLVPDAATYALAAALVPVYACLADAANRRVAAANAAPTTESLRRAWYPCDAPVAIGLARLLERARGLALQTRVRIGGVRCLVCAAGSAATAWRDLKAKWTRDPHHLEEEEEERGDAAASSSSFDVLIHVHGGAFVASFEAAHWRWFHELATATDRTLVVVPDYDVAPEHVYPVAVNQIHRVYDAIISGDLGLQSTEAYGVTAAAFFDSDPRDAARRKRWKTIAAEMRFDVAHAPLDRRPTVASVTCSSESAGACILASAMTRIAKRTTDQAKDAKLRRLPDALLLAYPPLNLLQCESPSRILHSFDILLPHNTLCCCAKAYGATDDDKNGDLMSYYAPDAVLRHFPSTLLLCGGTDPLLDDAVDFHTRLKRAGVDSHLLVHRRLTHGFLGMLSLGPLAPPHALELARHAVRFLGRAAEAARSSSPSPSSTTPNGAASP
ncbi:hypothetical protein CTAYLR_007239 [Chrysophaeum taylorii]|uniref:Alpha/beta hydrolase fold-3 domain-containing protein n=1 Tax=Chrysophaeum taylorii TaxID=2483200 RepID=A0AAD7UBK1_9STRA|nr:hypothetical protein CTAYLR_007239 [Chrysophaeum taylorii]